MEIQRLRVAMDLPLAAQKVVSSGRQSTMSAPEYVCRFAPSPAVAVRVFLLLMTGTPVGKNRFARRVAGVAQRWGFRAAASVRNARRGVTLTVRQPGCGEHPSKGRQHRSERPMGWRLAIVQKNYTHVTWHATHEKRP